MQIAKIRSLIWYRSARVFNRAWVQEQELKFDNKVQVGNMDDFALAQFLFLIFG